MYKKTGEFCPVFLFIIHLQIPPKIEKRCVENFQFCKELKLGKKFEFYAHFVMIILEQPSFREI